MKRLKQKLMDIASLAKILLKDVFPVLTMQNVINVIKGSIFHQIEINV